MYSNRSKQCHFDGHVPRIECENRTNVKLCPYIPSENWLFGIRNFSIGLNACQLFYSGLGKWIVSFDISGYVSRMLHSSTPNLNIFPSSSSKDALQLEITVRLFGGILARDFSICLHCPGLCSSGVLFGRLVQLIHVVCQRYHRRLSHFGWRLSKGRKTNKIYYEELSPCSATFCECQTVELKFDIEFCVLKTWNNHQHWFLFRLISQFNHIYEFIVTGIFAWTLSAIASSLLVVQLELVE